MLLRDSQLCCLVLSRERSTKVINLLQRHLVKSLESINLNTSILNLQLCFLIIQNSTSLFQGSSVSNISCSFGECYSLLICKLSKLTCLNQSLMRLVTFHG